MTRSVSMTLCGSRATDSRAQGGIAVWEVAPESVQLILLPSRVEVAFKDLAERAAETARV
jgi:hypothetical protein